MKLLTNILLACCLAAAMPLHADGRDSVPVLERVDEYRTLRAGFHRLPYANPAMQWRRHARSLTEVEAGADLHRESRPAVMQQGDGHRLATVDVQSFANRPEGSLWGEAGYRNGTYTNLKWNETSDYDLLYPYVMGDSVGGDLRTEQYRFQGGYAGRAGRIVWGAEAAYRATLAYRQVDPRPHNIAARLQASLGAAWNGWTRYRPGLSVRASKYKQENNIKFYNEQGSPALYHFTGLGMDYYRFRGERKETYYKGYTLGASLDLLPRGGSGWSASLAWERFSFEKIISSLNELPMAGVVEHTWQAEAGYTRHRDNRSWGMRADAALLHRAGTENLFGTPANNIYPLIVSARQYARREVASSLTGYYEREARGGWAWAVHPCLSFHRQTETYASPSRHLQSDHAGAHLTLQGSKRWHRILLTARAAGGWSASLHPVLVLEAGAQGAGMEALHNNFATLSASRGDAGASLRADFALRPRCSLYLAARYAYARYTDGNHAHQLTAQVGVAF